MTAHFACRDAHDNMRPFKGVANRLERCILRVSLQGMAFGPAQRLCCTGTLMETSQPVIKSAALN